MGHRYFPIQAQMTREFPKTQIHSRHPGASRGPVKIRPWMPAFAGMTFLFGILHVFAEDKGALPDILIQAEEKRPVQRVKPPLQFPLKEEAPLDTMLQTEDEVRLKLPSEISKTTRFVTNSWNSPHVATPSGNFIILTWKGEPAHVFHPMAELGKIFKEKDVKDYSKARWELLVVDSAGKPFRKFNGVGAPPDKLPWDGKSDEGNWLRVGLAYTGVLNYLDTQGHSHTALGRPFALAGLSLQQTNGNILIALAAKQLFETEKGPGKLSERGTRLLAEASQLIQRHHPGLGLNVSARLSRADAAWVQTAAETCAHELSKRLLAASGSIKIESHAGTKDIEERVDLTVGDRTGG